MPCCMVYLKKTNNNMFIKIYSVPKLVCDVVHVIFIVCFLFCQYCNPLGLLFPLRAEYILFLLKLYFYCNLDQDVLVISYPPWSK